MSIIEAYNEAWDNGDVDTLAKIIHDDCVFNPHVGGITMSKSDSWLCWWRQHPYLRTQPNPV